MYEHMHAYADVLHIFNLAECARMGEMGGAKQDEARQGRAKQSKAKQGKAWWW